MREIKFRAWDKEENSMCSWDEFIKNYHSTPLISLGKQDEYLIWMQYTGLKDKNGKEIYEGDIVEFKPNDRQAQPFKIGVVYWDSSGSYVVTEKSSTYIRYVHPIEIIGNIYENPELLKELKENERT